MLHLDPLPQVLCTDGASSERAEIQSQWSLGFDRRGLVPSQQCLKPELEEGSQWLCRLQTLSQCWLLLTFLLAGGHPSPILLIMGPQDRVQVWKAVSEYLCDYLVLALREKDSERTEVSEVIAKPFSLTLILLGSSLALLGFSLL